MRISAAIILFVLAVKAMGQSPGKSESPVVFTVKAEPTFAEEFIYLYKKNHQKAEDLTDKKINEYLDLLVNFKLKVMEARARGLDTTGVFISELRTYRDELKKPYVGQKDDLETLTREAYQRLTEEIKASHILIGVKPGATQADTLLAYKKTMDLRQRILAGEDFEKLAKAFSEDPSAKVNGGNLGYFTALQMVYPFEQQAYRMKVGEVSPPVRTRFGYHLIKVLDRRPAQGEVEVSHIILRLESGDDPKVKNKIFGIYDQLRGGRNWDDLCKEYSEDPATRNTGGRLRPFGVGALAAVPEFEAMAFSLGEPGEISDPFKTAYGWHIIRLERKIPLPSYGDVEASLKRRVARDERFQLAEEKNFEEKKRIYDVEENQEVKKQVLAMADSNLIRGQWKFSGAEEWKAGLLCNIQRQPHKAGEFFSFVQKNQTKSSLPPAAYMEHLYEQFLMEKMIECEEAKLMAEVPAFRNVLTEYKEGILLFTIMEKEVWNKASEDTTGLRKFYDGTKEKYRAGERVRARVFSTTDKDFFEGAKSRVNQGDSLSRADLRKFKSVVPWRNFERGDNKAVDKVSWSAGVHDTEVEGNYYLVEIEKLLPAGIRAFEEVRAQVISAYQDELEKKWVTELKGKYPVKINNKGRKFVVNELTKK